jgi:negative regulator of sigma E activity
MRLGMAASCLSLCVAVFAVQPAMTQTAAQSAATAPSAGTAPSAATATPTATTPAAGDAAAKHAKRTACLQEAKTKKLVGAEKTAFLRDCLTAQ